MYNTYGREKRDNCSSFLVTGMSSEKAIIWDTHRRFSQKQHTQNGKTLTERSSRWLITTYCVLGLDRSLQQPLYIIHWLRIITFIYFKPTYAHAFKKHALLIKSVDKILCQRENIKYYTQLYSNYLKNYYKSCFKSTHYRENY